MKKMIQEKNAKIKTLRDKLGKYESVDEDDDWERYRGGGIENIIKI